MDIPERTEVFRGHLKECLQHLGKELNQKVPKRGKGVTAIREPIVKFCGVNSETVFSWIVSPKLLPVGEVRLRVWCYMDSIGYHVIEFHRLPKLKHGVAELLGYRVLSKKNLMERLGYTKSSHLFAIIYGSKGIRREREQIMWDLWKENKDILSAAKQKACSENLFFLSPAQPALAVAPPPHFSVLPKANRKVALGMIEGLLALLQDKALDCLTLEELTQLQVSPNTILSLQSQLHSISSKLFGEKTKKGA